MAFTQQFGYGVPPYQQFGYNQPRSEGGGFCGSLCGMLIGFGLFFSTCFLIFWNEGAAVQTAKSLSEGLEIVQSVSLNDVSSNLNSLNGKLIHFTGFVDAEEAVDSEFGVKSRVLKMDRRVKMLQWVEEKRESHREIVNQYTGGREVQTISEYFHVQKWESSFHDSSNFHASSNGMVAVNPPSMPYRSANFVSSRVYIGEMKLSKDTLDLLSTEENFSIKNSHGLSLPGQLKLINGRLQTWEVSSSPKVGDITVDYSVLAPGTFSMIGQVQGGVLSKYQASAGDHILMIEKGSRSAEAMFQSAQDFNTVKTWLLRGLALFLMFLSFQLILGPISAVFSLVPLLGSFLQSIVGVGVSLAAVALAVTVTFLVTAVSWFVFRPLLSITLIVCAMIPMFFLKNESNARNARRPER